MSEEKPKDIVYVDRMEAFRTAVKALAPGSVKHADGVRLQEVISAVEILDPRTDSNCGYKSVQSLKDLVAAKQVLGDAELKGLTQEDYQSTLERLFMLETMWLEGRALPQTIFTCAYMHDLSALAKVCPLLHAYLRGVTKFVVQNVDVIARADVREEDEFPTFTFNLNLHTDDAVPDVIAALENAHADVTKRGWTTVAAYFAFHIALVRIGSELDRGVAHVGVTSATHIPSALQALEIMRKGAAGSHTPNSGKLFHETTVRWVTSLTPLAVLAPIPMANVFTYFAKLLNDLNEVCATIPKIESSLSDLMSFVMDFSASTPCLMVRSRLMVLAYNNETSVILEKETITNLVVDMFATTYGCPTLKLIYQGDEPTLKAISAYRFSKFKELKKYRSDVVVPDIDDGTQFMKLTQHQVMEFLGKLGRVILHMLFSVLNNRARYRRRLANLFADLGTLQQMAWEIDTNIFGGGINCLEHYFNGDKASTSTETCEQCTAAQQAVVLTAFVMDIVLRCMLDFMLVGVELELYATEELSLVYTYTDYALSCLAENCNALYKARDFITRNGGARTQRLFPPIVLARKMCLPTPAVALRVDALRYIIGGLVRFHCYLSRAEVLPPTASRGIVSLRTKHEHRFHPFTFLMRPSYFRYEAYERHLGTFHHMDMEVLLDSARQCLLKAIERCEEIRSGVPNVTADICSRWIAMCKANLVCAKIVSSLVEKKQTSEWTVGVDVTSGNLSLPVYKLGRKPLPAPRSKP
jgi:hypothetical protein